MDTRTVHFSQRSLNRSGRSHSVRMRCHDANDAACPAIQASSNDSEHNILGCENARNLGRFTRGQVSDGCLRDNDSGGAMLAHELGCISDSRTDMNCDSRGASVDERGNLGSGHGFSDLFDIVDERLVGAGPFSLNAFEGRVELLRGIVGALQLLQR